MKKVITILSCICGLMIMSTSLMAQDQRMSEEDKAAAKKKMESLKVGFITTQLDLTSDEAQKFWPIYNDYHDEMEGLRQQAKDGIVKDDDPNKQLDQFFEMEESVLGLKKKYALKVKSTIGAEKTIKLLQVEKRFARNVLENYKDRMKENKHGGYRNGK